MTWLAVNRFRASISSIWLITAADWAVRSLVLVWYYARGKWAKLQPQTAEAELAVATNNN